jgi:hypothetical protein
MAELRYVTLTFAVKANSVERFDEELEAFYSEGGPADNMVVGVTDHGVHSLKPEPVALGNVYKELRFHGRNEAE